MHDFATANGLESNARFILTEESNLPVNPSTATANQASIAKFSASFFIGFYLLR